MKYKYQNILNKWRNIMKFFIDTANIEEIKKAASMGIVCGVTTNPSLIAKEGRDFHKTILEIAEIVDGPISAEVISLESDKMVEEALVLSKLHRNVIIKVPMTDEGLRAVKILSSKGIKTNVTLIFSAAQALLAAKAGATYVSPFVGRLDDIGLDGIMLIQEIVDIFDNYVDINTEIIAASIRNPIHATRAAALGCHIATVPFKILVQMLNHPLTDKGIQQFLADWEGMKNK
jgi:transaldolase